MSQQPLPFNATRVLNDGFVGLVDHMGDDSAIVQAARVSYGKDEREDFDIVNPSNYVGDEELPEAIKYEKEKQLTKDTNLIRYLMRHRHTTPFEMVEFKFIVRVPMDCWRQWIRHRTASVNEYSTRYTEAIDSQQTTPPDAWRLQATNNKQGSSGYLEEWPEELPATLVPFRSYDTPGGALSKIEYHFHNAARETYEARLTLGVAKEQARKDLPLSTYTEAYWKIDLHNLFHFLSLRMDSHAQYEIRQYANAIFDLIKPIVPVACKAFEDYRLNSVTFSGQEMSVLQANFGLDDDGIAKPYDMSDREWTEFKEKLK